MPNNIHIHIPNTPDEIPVCAAAVKEFTKLIGFKRRDINRIALVVEEVLLKIIGNSYIDKQIDEITILLLKTNEGIRIEINNHGIPIDSDKIVSHKPEEESEFSSLRLFALKLVDNISFEAKGYQGNEIIIEKHFISKKVKKVIPKKDNNAEVETDFHKQDYSIRFLKEEETNDVSKLAFIAYHYSYPYEIIYIPKLIKEKISKNEMVSAVAVLNSDEKIISHSALVLHNENSKTAEIGIALTDPNFRGYGCINKLWDFLIDDVAQKRNLFGVFAMAVTSHPYSQKASHKMGMVDSALFISRTPVLGFEDIEIGEKQRESIMIVFKVLNSIEKVTIYPPKNHRKIVIDISSQIGINVTIGKHIHINMDVHHNYSNLEVERDKVFQIANIIIFHIGKDLKTVFEKEFELLKIERFESIYLFLDLADYHTEKYTAIFEKYGFFFAGIKHKENRMNLVLQYLNNQTYNFDTLKIASNFGKKLTEYVKKEYEKTII